MHGHEDWFESLQHETYLATFSAQPKFVFVAGLVAPYMKLRGGVEFVDEIPRSMSGKILRRTLRAMAGPVGSRL